VHQPDGGLEARRFDVLEQIAGCAGLHCGDDLVVGGEARQHDDPGVGDTLADAADGGHAAEPGHHEVHEHDIGTQPFDRGHGGLTLAGFADDLDAVT
jgi:hypothetical protein